MEITVNDKVIGEREIAHETQYHPADTFEQRAAKLPRPWSCASCSCSAREG